VRIALEKAPIHISTRVSLVCIDDHIFYISGGIARLFPLSPGGKAATTSTSQFGFFDFLQYFLGGHLKKRFFQRGITANCQIVIDALGINTAVGSEYEPLLILVEGNFGFVSYLFFGVGVGIE
jgi:hypothetical protein